MEHSAASPVPYSPFPRKKQSLYLDIRLDRLTHNDGAIHTSMVNAIVIKGPGI